MAFTPRKFQHLQRLRNWMRLRRGTSFLRRAEAENTTEGNASEGEMTKEEMNRMLFLGAMMLGIEWSATINIYKLWLNYSGSL